MKNEGPQEQPWPAPYERPNQKWLCGRSDQVFPCPLGPDGRGRCRTTAECSPVLETKPGEQKGRYRCTRRAEFGGPCAEGPLPSGACSHAQPPCAPRRSLRSRRALFTYWIAGMTVAALLLLLRGERRFRFANPGPLSRVHAQPKGVQGQGVRVRENCSACHRSATTGLRNWAEAAAGANPHPIQFASFLRPSPATPTRMDGACAQCHRSHQFHHVNMSQDQSCLQCHVEHRGDEGLRVTSAGRCVSCHGDSRRMEEARGVTLPMVLRGGSDNAVPPAVITRFRENHPEFSPIRSKMADPNTLRFNHQKHLAAPVVGANGRPLQCADCHEEDPAGEYHQRIRFARHCQSCHSLQFDADAPELQLPHGEVEFVKAFLGSLPQQYEDYGRKVRGITEKRALQGFVDRQMRRFEERRIGGGNLLDEVFPNRSRRQPASGSIVPFYGCAYCHEVTGSNGDYEVAKAVVPIRWLNKGAFAHREHQNVSCTTCHEAARSSQTSDILLPSVKTCASCHSSNAAPGDSCTLCHKYHHWKEQLLSGVP